MSRKDLSEYARLLRVVANPTRLMILAELRAGTRCVNDIRDLLRVSQPNVSQHLAVLKKHGLVASRTRGAARCYYLLRPELTRGLLGLMPAAGLAAPPRTSKRRARRGAVKAGGRTTTG